MPSYQAEPSAYITFCQSLPSVCNAYNHAPFLLALAFWLGLQLTWTLILLGSQLWQVSRQMTTLEVSNLGRYGFMGGRGGTSLRDQSGALAAHRAQAASAGAVHHHANTSTVAVGAGAGPSGAQEDSTVVLNDDDDQAPIPNPVAGQHAHGRACDHHHRHGHGSRCGALGAACSRITNCCSNGPLLQLLGLDRFTKGEAGRGLRLAEKRGGNPFNKGVVTVGSTFIAGSDSNQELMKSHLVLL